MIVLLSTYERDLADLRERLRSVRAVRDRYVNAFVEERNRADAAHARIRQLEALLTSAEGERDAARAELARTSVRGAGGKFVKRGGA